MKVLGVITEYNPFHNGHKYHIEKSKEITGCDTTIAIMSGNFVQKGQPAIYDKFSRANMAINNGIDLVIELPTIFSTGSSEYFAYGSIELLNKLNVISSICFGSESGNIQEIENVSNFLIKNDDRVSDFSQKIKEYMKKGFSFPYSREKALNDFGINLNNIVSSPNNILGIEYLKALKKLNSNMIPYTIKRTSDNYNKDYIDCDEVYISATSVRKAIVENNLNKIEPFIPNDVFKKINDSRFLDNNSYTNIIRYKILNMSLKDLKNIQDISEGLENRIKKAVQLFSNYNDLVEYIKTKRYTRTRIQRILIYILLDITKKMYKKHIELGNQYVRVLAFNDKGKKLISQISNCSKLPIIVSIQKNKSNFKKKILDMLNIDLKASDIYSILCKDIANKDYKNNFHFKKEKGSKS